MAQLADKPSSANNDMPDQLLESLGRLSKKPGVLATIILDRISGAILTTTGSVSLAHTPIVATTSPVINAVSGNSDNVAGSSGGDVGRMALMVWNFVNMAGGLVQELDAEDEIKLLRLRTKKYEFVIVPDSKYLLTVVHETPSA